MTNKVITSNQWSAYQAKRALDKASGKAAPVSTGLSTDNDFYIPAGKKVKSSYPSLDDYDSAYSKHPAKSSYGSAYTYKGSTAATSLAPRCYTTHKPLPIVVGANTYLIYGGACGDPIIKDADIYVGFEYGMKESKQNYPWHTGSAFTFHIQDGNVPSNLEEAKNLIKYLADNLIAGKKIHIGCIGGHGRTGTILAALVTHMTGNTNSIEYVRTNYCPKAVESHTQIDWLNKHWGIEKVAPSKSYTPTTGQSSFGFMGNTTGVSKSYANKASNTLATVGYSLVQTVKPVKVKGSIWGF